MTRTFISFFAGALLLVAVAVPALGGGSVYAFTNGGGNSANAPGQANAIANCADNIGKQNANGQTGSDTGSANDEKQLNTAVTNCDHFWDGAGSNP